jgi:hypothetical protein
MTPGLRRLGDPRPAAVRADAGGRPTVLHRTPVETISEEWVVEDRWWTDAPLRRRYFEAVLADGRNVVVFCELEDREKGWFEQRA